MFGDNWPKKKVQVEPELGLLVDIVYSKARVFWSGRMTLEIMAMVIIVPDHKALFPGGGGTWGGPLRFP